MILPYISLSLILDFQADNISGAGSARVVSNSADENKSNVAAAENIRQFSADLGHRDDRQIVLSDAEALAETAAIVAIGHSPRHSAHSRVGRNGAADQAASDHHKSTAAGHPEDRAESVASAALAIPGDRHGEGERERRIRQTPEHLATRNAAVAHHTSQLRRL